MVQFIVGLLAFAERTEKRDEKWICRAGETKERKLRKHNA